MKTLIAYPAYKNRKTNPYQALLYTELEKQGWKVWDLGQGMLRCPRPDILHIHWPDGFAFHRGNLKTRFRSSILLLIMLWYRMLGTKVVWTLHNLRSHEQFHPHLEARFWKQYYRRLDGWIALNGFSEETAQSMPVLRSLPFMVIPHGLYPRLGNATAKEARSREVRRLLLFGKLRPYKEVPTLVEAFEKLGDRNVRLVIAGQCHDASLGEYLEDKEKRIPGLQVMAEFIPDEKLDQLIVDSDVVIIPYAGSLNSGVVFLALAYGKTVIAPATPSFEEIVEDFGERLVRLYDPPLDADKLSHLLSEAVEGSGIPDDTLSKYSWPRIAKSHDAFFREMVS